MHTLYHKKCTHEVSEIEKNVIEKYNIFCITYSSRMCQSMLSKTMLCCKLNAALITLEFLIQRSIMSLHVNNQTVLVLETSTTKLTNIWPVGAMSCLVSS